MKSFSLMPENYYFQPRKGGYCFHCKEVGDILAESPIDDYDNEVAHIKWTGLEGKPAVHENLYRYKDGMPTEVIGRRYSTPFGIVTRYTTQESYTNWTLCTLDTCYHDYDWDKYLSISWLARDNGGIVCSEAPSDAALSLIYHQLANIRFESTDNKVEIIRRFCTTAGAEVPNGLSYSTRVNSSWFGDNNSAYYREVDTPPTASSAVELIKANTGIEWHSVDQALDDAYLELLQEMRLDANNVAAVIELIELVKGLKRPLTLLEDAGNAVKRLAGTDGWKDAWLKYRYVFNTTRSDIRDFREKFRTVTSTDRGTFVIRTAWDEPVNTHIKLTLEEDFSSMSVFDDVTLVLKKFGLYPDAYCMWDLVPFSFVADWFLPLGDALEHSRKVDWATSLPYKTKMLVSHKGSGSVGGWTFDFYYRYQYHPTPSQFKMEGPDGTWHTWVQRGLDLIALH